MANHIGPDEEGCFEQQMVFHMQRQTMFLESIYEAIKAVRTVVQFVSTAIGLVVGGFGLLEMFKQIKH